MNNKLNKIFKNINKRFNLYDILFLNIKKINEKYIIGDFIKTDNFIKTDKRKYKFIIDVEYEKFMISTVGYKYNIGWWEDCNKEFTTLNKDKSFIFKIIHEFKYINYNTNKFGEIFEEYYNKILNEKI
jgi:hypothetical protein